LLRKHGYTTAAIIANYSLSASLGFDRGFDYYLARRNVDGLRLNFRPIAHLVPNVINAFPEIRGRYRKASHINSEVFQWLEEFRGETFFLLVNYMEPHMPYAPPKPFDTMFQRNDKPYNYSWLPSLSFFLGLINSSELAEYISTQYDGEIAYLDHELGRLFQKMKKLGIYESSLIIVTSDHGEFLGEHSALGHASYLYEQVLKVPLLIKLPFASRTGIEPRPIQTVDILPTAFDICGLPLPGGLSGSPWRTSHSPIVGEYFNTQLGAGIHRVIYEGRYKLMYYTHSRDPELYDLKQDLGEATNLRDDKKQIVATLSRRLSEWTKAHPPRGSDEDGASKELPKTVLEDLKALGYIK
jgi:arylsulfatase A-like enzyme